ASEPIPLFLFSEARPKFGEPLACALAGDGLDEAVAALRPFALVDRETIVDERDPTFSNRDNPTAPPSARSRDGPMRGRRARDGATRARRGHGCGLSERRVVRSEHLAAGPPA